VHAFFNEGAEQTAERIDDLAGTHLKQQVDRMNGSDKRRHIRVESTNLLNFVCKGVDGEPCHQGMGRTLNVSESGILLETYKPIDSRTPISITIGIEEELIDIEGEVVFLNECAKDIYAAGIRFSQINDKERMVLLKFIEVFKKKLD
jgi:hypothetical protein